MKTTIVCCWCYFIELLVLLMLSQLNCLTGQRLVGVTFRKWPYVERSVDASSPSPDKWIYSGYFVELLNEIKVIKPDFEYELYFARDGLNELVKMDTLIQELNSNRAHFAIADLTVTDLHRHMVDFTESFMETTTAALVHKSNVCGLHTISELVEQNKLEFGTVAGSITNYELSGDDPIKQYLFNIISQNPHLYVNTLDEGIIRVNHSNYALLTESIAAEFYSKMYCDLTVIGDRNADLYRRPYAIALKKGSPYLGWFNSAILTLKREGVLADLKSEFWQNTCADHEVDYCNAGVKSTLTEVNAATRSGQKWWSLFSIDWLFIITFMIMCFY